MTSTRLNCSLLLEWEQARSQIAETLQDRAPQLATECVPILQAHGRVLAEVLTADRDYPALRRSLRDGFAVRTADVPGTLTIRGERRAGDIPANALNRGEALEIMTGAPVPAEADAVVMVEHVTRTGDRVAITKPVEPGQFINEPGSEARAGQALIPLSTRLDASHIATLAMAGNTEAIVFRKPRVAILGTGDEIVGVETQPAPHQVRNSNSYLLSALITAAGGTPVMLPVAPDQREALTRLLEQGLQADMLVVSGGVSAGKYDLVKPCLRELGTEFLFERVRIQPGQPTAFGMAQGRPVFGLPGNPGSTLVTFQLFAQLALALICGVAEPTLPLLRARFAVAFRHRPGLTRFLPAYLAEDGESLHHIPWQGSSDVPALARANVFLVAEHDRETWAAGDWIRVISKL